MAVNGAVPLSPKEFAACDIQKKVLHFGRSPPPSMDDGSRLHFHWQARRCDGSVLDDSKSVKKPMELVLGKEFKLPIWERCLKTMCVEEVANFTCTAPHCFNYPIVARSLRDFHAGRPSNPHCCAGMVHAHKDDLGDLLKNPEPLEFTFELLRVDEAGQWDKDTWIMTDDERTASLPTFRMQGNAHYAAENYRAAAASYSEALEILDGMCLKEKPGEEEYITIDQSKTPFYANLCQCQLKLDEPYKAIDTATEVLQRDPDNVKATYRRGLAHLLVWNELEGRADMTRAVQLDPSLQKTVSNDLKKFEKKLDERLQEEKLAALLMLS